MKKNDGQPTLGALPKTCLIWPKFRGDGEARSAGDTIRRLPSLPMTQRPDRVSFWTVCCAAMIFSGAALANSADSGAIPSDSVKKKKKARVVFAPKTAPAPKVPANTEAQGTAPIDPKAVVLAGSPARLDKVYGLKGWNIPFPSFGDTLLQDYGGWRTTLAKYGFGFLAYNITISATNMLNTPLTNNGKQAYWGQRGSVVSISVPYLTYDLSQFGVPNGQLQFAGIFINSSWAPYYVTENALYRLAYYQTFFDNKVEVNVGLMSNVTTFVGVYVGGQLTSPFGPGASIPAELGLANGSAIQPTAWLKYNMTENLYNTFGVARSIAPTASTLLVDHQRNPANLNFSEPGAWAVYADEIGYKQKATPDAPSMWVRTGIIYNTSLYHNYATGGESTNSGFYALADRQIWQVDPVSPTTAHRGLYVGVSAMYAPPTTNIFSQYYEARLYALGLFESRPKDMISVVYNHQVLSHYLADSTNLKSYETGVFARNATNTLTATYTVNLTRGLYLTAGLGFTDHPSVTYLPKEGSALNFLGSLYTAF